MSNRTPDRPSVHARTAARRPEETCPADLSARTGPEPAPGVRLEVLRGDPPEHLFRRLLSTYLAGTRSFEVTERPALSAGTREVVREFCRRTRQPEVVAEGRGALRLHEGSDCAADALDARLLRLGQQVVAFHRQAVASWDRLSFDDDRSWERRDDEIDREAWYLERCIALGEMRGLGLNRPASGAWTIARSLERIADHAVTLGELGPRLADLGETGSPQRELRQFHRQAMAHLEGVLADPDGARANDLLDVGEALLTAGRALAERLLPAVGDGSMAPAAAAAVARALEAMGRTVAYSQDIAQAFFDRSAGPSGSVGPVPASVVAPPSVG